MKYRFGRAVLIFLAMYLPMHVLSYFGFIYDFWFMMAASVILGLAEGCVFLMLKPARKNDGKDFVVFLVLFLAVFAYSAALFYTSPHEGVMYLVFYYFPQMVEMVYLIPCVVLFWLVTEWKSIFRRAA